MFTLLIEKININGMNAVQKPAVRSLRELKLWLANGNRYDSYKFENRTLLGEAIFFNNIEIIDYLLTVSFIHETSLEIQMSKRA